MAVAFDVRQFKSTTSAIGTTIDVTLALGGQVPKVIWVFSCGRTEAVGTDGVGLGNINLTYGFAIATNNRRCISGHVRAASGTTSTDRGFRNDAIGISMAAATGAFDGLLDVNDMSTVNKVQFIVDQVFTADELFVVAALAGDAEITSLAIVDVDKSTNTTTPLDVDITTVGFAPTYVECISGESAGTFPQGPNASASLSIGRSTPGDGNNQLWSAIDIDNVGTTDNASYCLSSAQNFSTLSSTAVLDRWSITQSLANGFRWHSVENDATARKCSFLCLAGTFNVGFFQLFTQAGQQSISLGISARGGLVFSACRAASTDDTVSVDLASSLGAFCGPQNAGRSMCVGLFDNDNVGGASSKASTAVRAADMYVNINSAGTAVEGAMGLLNQADVPGILTFGESVTDAQANTMFGVVFGDQFIPPPATKVQDMIDDSVWSMPAAR